ncbi:hypothetical protein RD1_0733 [Roseobacter denitrificans OCh 114]|uniref:Uncharacterized protein n=1 Tax=Roseobacter denitrificans (strain ATCC 33942 / OCh 114) TaxID=375451 RepID=Q16C75_ROSDO|nr:hypothetical protein RD1_0733 [Roseobacter denitrificans OCh 114]
MSLFARPISVELMNLFPAIQAASFRNGELIFKTPVRQRATCLRASLDI